MSKNIILIEDTHLLRFQIRRHLVENGYTNISEYSSADKIVNDPDLHLKDVDLIILDIGLPNVDGIELAEKLSNMPEYSNIPIVFISGRNDTATVKKAINAGGIDYFVKPIKYDDFISRIDKILGKHLVIKSREERMKEIDRIIISEYDRANRGNSSLGFLLYQANLDLLDNSQSIVEKHLRRIDSVLLMDEQILVLLPLTAEEHLSAVIKKINEICQKESLDLQLMKSFAFHPSTKMSFEEIMEELYN